MFARAANQIAENMVKHGGADVDDKDIHIFGAQQGLVMLLNIITFAVIGLIVGVFWQVVIFACAYISLRIYTGGYHAPTPLKCYISATVMVLAVAMLMRFVDVSGYITIIVLFICGLLISRVSPVDNENKSLDENEKGVYKRKAVIIGFAQISIAFICLHFGLTIVTASIFWAMVSVVILMILEIIMKTRRV
ncbi:MAG: accessory gene regulator B family protein [Defluviitaleaceae bacterium]|nr:accessory gene regulator B family protein [Defluviitaleaceae bacterium]